MKRLIKTLLLFCFFLSLQAFSKEIRFIQITDINLNTKNAYKLQDTIKEINSFKNIDFVVFGGNNIQRANINNLNTFLYLLRRTHKKSYVLLGSTDVSSANGIDKNYYLKRVKRVKWFHSSKPNYTFKQGDYLFITMDGSKQYFQTPNGYYSKAELLWLDKTLEKNKDKKVIILQHFPLLETDSKWMQTAKVEDYEEILKKHDNVKVIVCGHYDVNKEIKKDNIYHILTESYSKSGAYKVIEIDLEKDFIGTYLIKD